MSMVSLFGFAALLSTVAAKDVICSRAMTGEWLPDPDDCASVVICFNERSLKYKCPRDTVWNPTEKICVERGSDLDVCDKVINQDSSIRKEPPHVPCTAANVAREPHESNCAKYYECPRVTGDKTEKPLLKECPYPLLFDEDTNTCQFAKRAKCTRSFVPKDPCEYEENKCKSVMCVPCKVRMPSCKNLPDGLNVWQGKEWTPDYIVCDKERVVFHGICELSEKGTRKLFNPDKKSCEERIVISFPI